MITVPEFKKRKEQNKKMSMITCYDASFAKVLSESPIDILLIGDSSSMVMQGFDSTVHSTTDAIASFTVSVARGCNNKFIVADMVFLSVRKSKEHAVEAAEKLIKAGAHAVKIEGVRGNEEIIKHLTESGVPVMGHLGLTPQFVNAFGGMKVQAKTPEEQDVLLQDAKRFEELGAFSLVLECVPSSIAAKITKLIKIPTIGIGAGPDVDGQVLVLQDLLGFNPSFKPKFLKTYMNGYEQFQKAFSAFHEEVQNGVYPNEKESYSS